MRKQPQKPFNGWIDVPLLRAVKAATVEWGAVKLAAVNFRVAAPLAGTGLGREDSWKDLNNLKEYF